MEKLYKNERGQTDSFLTEKTDISSNRCSWGWFNIAFLERAVILTLSWGSKDILKEKPFCGIQWSNG